jgi:hypothetical protein
MRRRRAAANVAAKGGAMEVQAVLDKARAKLEHAPDGTPPVEKQTSKATIALRAVLPLVALAGLAALLLPRKPAPKPKSRFPITLPFL